MEDRWNTDRERRDMTVWVFDEESFVPMAMIKEEMCIRDRISEKSDMAKSGATFCCSGTYK